MKRSVKAARAALLAGALLSLLSGCTVSSAPASSSPVSSRTSAGAVHLQGALARQETLGHESLLHLRLRSDIVWPWAPLLHLEGIQHWRIHLPRDNSGLPEGVGSCVGLGEEVPFVLREEATGETYVQMPYADCTVDLSITPRRTGQFPLTVSVLRRYIAGRDGVHILPSAEFTAPYRLRRIEAIRDLHLRWRVKVTGRAA